MDVTIAGLTLGGASGTQTISCGRNFTLNGSGVINSHVVLNITGGTLGGSGTLTNNGVINWSAGVITGSVVNSGTFNIVPPSSKGLKDGGVLTNTGTINMTSGFYTQNAATITNQAGANFNFQSDNSVTDSGGTSARVFSNAGTVSKTAGAGNAGIDITFNNTGSVNVTSGTFDTHGGTSSGAWSVASGTAIRFGVSSTTHILASGSTFTGAGTFNLADGALNVSVPVSMPNLSITGGILTGSGALTLTGVSSWSAGVINGTVVNNGTLNIVPPSSKGLKDGGVLTNTGTINVTAGFYTQNAATITNQAGGNFNFQNDSSITDSGGTSARVFNNAGTISKTAGTGNAGIDITFNSTGGVAVTSGTFDTRGGTSSGAWSVTSGTAIRFGINTTTHTLGAGSTLSGAGTFNLADGALNINAPVSVPNLSITNGTLTGSGTITLTGASSWSTGVINGTVVNNGTLSILPTSTKGLKDGGVLTNTGTINVTGSFYTQNAATITNQAGANFNFQNDNSITDSGGTSARVFNNAGTVSKTGGTGTAGIDIPFSNPGAVNVTSGIFTLGGGLANFSGTALTGGSYLVSSAVLRFPNANIMTNSASITLDGAGSAIQNTSSVNALANFATNASGAFFTVQNGRILTTAGAFSNAGTLVVGTGSTFTVTGGAFTSAGQVSGGGTIVANLSNSGAVNPGSSAGILTITGNYTQNSSGVLNVEIGGATAGTQYDRLAISGSATLGGTLNVGLLGGFAPSAGNTFQVMTFASRTGDFATKTGLGAPNNINLRPDLSADNLTLNAITVDKAIEAELAQDIAADSFVIFKVNVNRVKNISSGDTVTAIGGLGSYSASLTYNAAGVTVTEARGVAPFSTIVSSLNAEAGTRTTFSAIQTGTEQQAPANVAHLLPSLIGSKDVAYSVTLAFGDVVSRSGEVISVGSSVSLPNLVRGNAKDTDGVTIADALFVAQYLAGLRSLGTGAAAVNPVNAASVKHDTGGEKITITDALLIAQMLAGLRDASYNSA